MKTMTIALADSVDESEVKMQLAATLFENGIQSSGQAVKMANLSKKEFLEKVGRLHVSILSETADDLVEVLNG